MLKEAYYILLCILPLGIALTMLAWFILDTFMLALSRKQYFWGIGIFICCPLAFVYVAVNYKTCDAQIKTLKWTGILITTAYIFYVLGSHLPLGKTTLEMM